MSLGLQSPGEGNDYPLQYSCLGIPRTEEPGSEQLTFRLLLRGLAVSRCWAAWHPFGGIHGHEAGLQKTGGWVETHSTLRPGDRTW